MGEDFRKNCNEGINERYFLEVDPQYPENLHKLHDDLPFLPKKKKWNMKKVKNLVANLYDKT